MSFGHCYICHCGRAICRLMQFISNRFIVIVIRTVVDVVVTVVMPVVSVVVNDSALMVVVVEIAGSQ